MNVRTLAAWRCLVTTDDSTHKIGAMMLSAVQDRLMSRQRSKFSSRDPDQVSHSAQGP